MRYELSDFEWTQYLESQIGIAAHPSRRPLRGLLRMRSNLLKHNNLMLRSERRERLEAWAASDSPISHSRVLPGGHPEQFVEHLGLPGRRQWFVRQCKAEKRPVDDLGAGPRYIIGQSGRFEEA